MQDQHTMPAEEWRPVVGYEGLYEVSSLGRVRSLRFPIRRFLSLFRLRKGYLGVGLTIHRVRRIYQVHRLVATAFHGPPPLGHECNHKDGRCTHNAASNLEWMTRQQNIRHAHSIGLMRHSGSRNPTAKLTEAQVLEIRERTQSTRQELAEMFGVSVASITDIRVRRTWAHI